MQGFDYHHHKWIINFKETNQLIDLAITNFGLIISNYSKLQNGQNNSKQMIPIAPVREINSDDTEMTHKPQKAKF